MHRIAVLMSVSAVAVACAKPEGATKDSAKAPAAPAGAAGSVSAAKIGETTGLKTPESVRYDPELDVFYVSNINGNPSQHDGNGFIAVIRADSTGSMRTLVESGKNGATLDAPKGLYLVGDTLWVSDIDHVRAFNRRTGTPIADIDLSSQKATFLNDVAVGGDGAVYVTDTGIAFDAKGNISHPGTDQIFRIAGRTATSIKADSLNAPNGITWDRANGRFIVVGNSLVTWKPGDKSAATFATGPGQYDGVEILGDGRVLVTSWADSAVHLVQNGTMSTVVTNVSGPADIGIDTKRNVLVVPRFTSDKIEYYRLP
jgi:sugar lactone lactonase YvrE